MAYGLENPLSIEGQQAQIQSLEELYGTIPVYEFFSSLPSPASLIDGTIALVLELVENGQAGLVVTRSGNWTIPAAATPGTVSFAITIGAGAGELPESLVVDAGASVPLGATGATPWVIDPARSIARPSGVVVTPIDPASLEIGPRGAGIWRFALQVNYDATVPSTGLETRFVFQRDTGSGFADIYAGEIIRLAQSSPASVDGLTQIGVHLNIVVAVGEKYRIVVRHDDSVSRTYTFHDMIFVANQLVSPLT